MHYFLCVRLENFFVLNSKALNDSNQKKPICVLRDKLVLDADPSARAKGVFYGMPERQARAILDKGIFVAWEIDDYREAQGVWLNRCLPFTSVIEPTDQHEAFFDLSSHPEPRDIASQLYQALGTAAHLGAASSKWLASLAADSAPCGHIFDEAVNDPKGFLEKRNVACLSPIAEEHRVRLAFLGYRTIGEVAKLPLQVLKGQFGADALAIRQAAIGRIYQPVEAVYPPKSLIEALNFDGGTSSTLELDEGLVKLSEAMGEKLVSQEKQGSEVRLYIEFESGKVQTIVRRFQKVVRCRQSAISALRLMIPRELNEPIYRIRVLMVNLTNVPRVQRDLTGRTPNEQRGASAEAALRSLRTVFGDQSVVQATEIQMPRRVRVLKEWKESTGWR